MKKKLFFLFSLILLFAATTYAQVTTGVAIQGIARDANNTAKTSVTISFKFSVYYIKSGTTFTPVTQTISLLTDAFGVFSHILNLSTIDNTSIFENELFLKIEQGAVLISDEKLNYVPYAISASNGVPTGSIMPYMGITAPKGWVLCNGNALPSTATALIALVGANAPDLRGMFMRGAGTNTDSQHAGPALKAVQSDDTKTHKHGVSTITTSNPGNHNHTNLNFDRIVQQTGQNTATQTDNLGPDQHDISSSGKLLDNGAHTHTLTGNTDSIGGTETRPVNYGVNYIIKL